MTRKVKTQELAGADLLAALAVAMQRSYSDLRNTLSELSLEELQIYTITRPNIRLNEADTCDSADLREAILAHHEPAQQSQEDVWKLCEHLLGRPEIALSSKDISECLRNLHARDAEGMTAMEAIFRYYVKITLGKEVTLDA